jgi:hypothetical protein
MKIKNSRVGIFALALSIATPAHADRANRHGVALPFVA